MNATQTDITTLSRNPGGGDPRRGSESTPVPPRRWLLRVGAPLLLLAVSTGLLAYAARDALTPAIEVRVAPVVPKAASTVNDPTSTVASDAPGEVIAQGPGWIEPSPYAISIQALAEGVISEVLALEGDPVQQGQVVARMIDDDARLAAQRARSDVEIARADLDRAHADEKAASARADEFRDELQRKGPLVDAGGISEGQLARLSLRVRAAEHEEQAARAARRAAEASLARAKALLSEAELRLSRMEVRSPTSGVVMTRAVEPGVRVAMAGPGPGEGHAPGLFRIYDPQRLQVRVDVPLADASKVKVGDRAEVVTEALPDRAFRAEVVRIVHEADIQRNTVEVKVAIHEPIPALKPEMLARVRFYGARAPLEERNATGVAEVALMLLIAPTEALFEVEGERAKVWVVDLATDRRGPTAAIRTLTLAGRDGEGTLVREGLRPGDRVILDPPPSLREGARVRAASFHD